MAMGCAALALVTACADIPDFDLRGMTGNTAGSSASQALPARPQPDSRGVISYPNYQVVVAQRGDTVSAVAGRLGLDATALGQYNGINPTTSLRAGEIIALPTRVASAGGMPPASSAPILPGTIDVTTLASAAIDRAGNQGAGSTTSTGSGGMPSAMPGGAQPIRHQVQRGETAYSIARLYNVPVRVIADWNGLGPDLTVRAGQYLLVPTTATASSATNEPLTAPGMASPTPPPPSASDPLPAANAPASQPTTAAQSPAAPPAPDLTVTPSAPTASAKPLIYPVQGSIIRAYSKGRNNGIDIGVAAGTDVKAAAAGTVAAVTTDTNGVAIVVIKHANNMLTVYTNLENLKVAKNDSVTQGQVIGKVRAGSPSFLHFEVRQGLESVDPSDYLP
ncbi:MAG: peptidoglycan DD-metalloendopeptidase family protein [Limimaricola sp.]|nr:peptidoglycan DD-metalloendopeptidase family protein [Limimaricola sp.]